MSYPFVQARNYTRVSGGRKVDLIVIHTMESPEKPDTAEAVAAWFAGSTAPQASPHYCIDADSIVQCVRLDDVAWCAPGANSNGIHLEHAGRAAQTLADWSDPYSTAMLQLSAELTADLCKRFSIPATFLDAAALQRGERGITTHAEVSKAFPKNSSGHWDPGPNFPMLKYIAQVKRTNPARTPGAKSWPIPLPKWFWAWAAWRLSGRYRDRPKEAPVVIPDWAWDRLEALVKARKGK